CLHLELAHNREHHCNGACRSRLLSLAKPHRGACYTSSMCAFGHLPGDEREVMVYVVVDEPRGGKKYGADVAGPAAGGILEAAAVGILEEALGYVRGGSKYAPISPEGFALVEEGALARDDGAHPRGESARPRDDKTRRSSELANARSSEQPWAEDAHASR